MQRPYLCASERQTEATYCLPCAVGSVSADAATVVAPHPPLPDLPCGRGMCRLRAAPLPGPHRPTGADSARMRALPVPVATDGGGCCGGGSHLFYMYAKPRSMPFGASRADIERRRSARSSRCLSASPLTAFPAPGHTIQLQQHFIFLTITE